MCHFSPAPHLLLEKAGAYLLCHPLILNQPTIGCTVSSNIEVIHTYMFDPDTDFQEEEEEQLEVEDHVASKWKVLCLQG